MKSIWKKAALAVLAGAMAVSFTGCGGEKESGSSGGEKRNQKKSPYTWES